MSSSGARARVSWCRWSRRSAGPTGGTTIFRATQTTNLKSGAKLVIDGVQTNVDVRAGTNGEGVGCVLAPPTSVTGGGKYELLGTVAIHEAPEMPEQLAAILRGSANTTNTTNTSANATSATNVTVGTTSGHEALKQAALREVVRAGSPSTTGSNNANVGYPTRVVLEAHSARVDFAHRGTRVCPVSHNEHVSNHFCVVLRVEERTGLPALFVYCHSAKEGCKGSGHRMLCFLESTEGEELCAEAGVEVPRCVQQPTLGQAAVRDRRGSEGARPLTREPGRYLGDCR